MVALLQQVKNKKNRACAMCPLNTHVTGSYYINQNWIDIYIYCTHCGSHYINQNWIDIYCTHCGSYYINQNWIYIYIYIVLTVVHTI